MSNNLEDIIRPFTNGQVSPAQQYFQAGQVGVPPVILRFGRTASGKTLNGSFTYNATFYCTQYVNEKATADFGTPS